MGVFKSKTKLLVIIADQIGDFGRADLVVLPSVNCGLVTLGSRYMAGCAYSLLDPIYSRGKQDVCDGNVYRVLVNCGMLDSNNIGGSVLEALKEIEFEGEVAVTLGVESPNLTHLTEIASRAKYRFRLVTGEFNNYPYIEKSDFVVGSGGQGLLERLAVGRPSLTVIASDNQIDQAAYMGKLGATEVLEIYDFSELSRTLAVRLNTLFADKQLLIEMADIGMRLVDGKGAETVAQKIVQML